MERHLPRVRDSLATDFCLHGANVAEDIDSEIFQFVGFLNALRVACYLDDDECFDPPQIMFDLTGIADRLKMARGNLARSCTPPFRQEDLDGVTKFETEFNEIVGRLLSECKAKDLRPTVRLQRP